MGPLGGLGLSNLSFSLLALLHEIMGPSTFSGLSLRFSKSDGLEMWCSRCKCQQRKLVGCKTVENIISFTTSIAEKAGHCQCFVISSFLSDPDSGLTTVPQLSLTYLYSWDGWIARRKQRKYSTSKCTFTIAPGESWDLREEETGVVWQEDGILMKRKLLLWLSTFSSRLRLSPGKSPNFSNKFLLKYKTHPDTGEWVSEGIEAKLK